MGGRYIAPPANGFGKASDVRPKYINTPDTPIYHKSQILYGLYENQSAIRSTGKAVLVEGYMDVIGLSQAGIENAVASCGTALTDAQLTLLLDVSSSEGHAPDLLLCFDGDEAGRSAAWKAAEKSLEYLRDGVTIRVMFLPDGKDPYDLMQAPDGVGIFDRLAYDAAPVLDVLMRRLLERFPVNDTDSADRFMEEFDYYLSRVPGDACRKAWRVSAETVVAPYRSVAAAPIRKAAPTLAVDRLTKAQPEKPKPMLPRMSDAFVERAIWWLFHLPWEDAATIWGDVPVSWLLYAQGGNQSAGSTLEHLFRALNSLKADHTSASSTAGSLQGQPDLRTAAVLADAQTTAIRAILKKVEGQKDFMEVVKHMDADAQKAEVKSIVRKLAVHATGCRLAYIAGLAEMSGVSALTEEERSFLSSAGRGGRK
jgi:hypothetical protein